MSIEKIGRSALGHGVCIMKCNLSKRKVQQNKEKIENLNEKFF